MGKKTPSRTSLRHPRRIQLGPIVLRWIDVAAIFVSVIGLPVVLKEIAAQFTPSTGDTAGKLFGHSPWFWSAFASALALAMFAIVLLLYIVGKFRGGERVFHRVLKEWRER